MSVINTNILSLKGQSHLSRSRSELATAMERLSSGLRVNSAKDDAAGLAIGNRFQSQTTGLAQASRNANDGVSLSQTAQGVLDSINQKLHRIRELTVQGLNGTLSIADSDAIQAEINQNLQEIDRLVEITEYNGLPLMNGKAGQVRLQVGANDGESLPLDLSPPGFSIAALGLEDLNVAGVAGGVVERTTLRGQAQDIPLYDSSTTLTFASGSQQPLYYTSGFGYYTSDGAGGFSRVSVSASHETATDTSVVNIGNPNAIFRSNLVSGSELAPTLSSGQRLLSINGDTYLEERLSDNSLSYRAVGFTLNYQEDWVQQPLPGGGSQTVRIYPVSTSLVPSSVIDVGNYTSVGPAGSFEFGGASYSMASMNNTSFQRSNSTPLPNGQLMEDAEGSLYLHGGAAGNERYYRLTEVNTHDRLVVSAVLPYTPDPADTFVEVNGGFDFNSAHYDLGSFDELVLEPPGGTLVAAGTELYIRVGNDPAHYEYYAIDDVAVEQDLTLRADDQAFVGGDLQSQPALTNYQIPATNFTSFDPVTFQGADFSGLSNLTLVQRTTSEGSWIIRGEQIDGGFAYFETNLELEMGADGSVASVVATATQTSPTILGVASHERDKVSGYSQITIDPRNVTVEYTDAEGQTFEDVLRQNDDGSYYFALPGQSAVVGGYKTATLVDLEGTQEILLKTVNGSSEVVVYYPSNVNTGINFSVVALTDGDGFNNDGVPHTRLQIRENGEDFRLRTPPNPLAAIDRALGMVDAKRSYLGATENRLASVIEANTQTGINLSSARSRIMDADYAVEVANMTRAQILQQAGTSVLAQANQVPEIALALLG